MTMAKSAVFDADYSHIKFYAKRTEEKGKFCLSAELLQKTDNVYAKVDKLYYKGIILSDISEPINQEFYSAITSLIEEKKVHFAISTKDGTLKVDMEPK